ncbi:MAG: flagellar biosynthesis protein FlhA [Deltaproteobacteria bacterium]|nr:flagellar biosynthesis protein FlhA [Deltaproteobacteria bacterium]
MAAGASRGESVNGWLKSGNSLMALGIIGVLLVMMIPLPPFILDVLLSFNITFSIVILLVAVYVLKPLDFSVFPSVLLVSTLFRLSLNVASTRLILLRGNEGVSAAGQVIQAFGSFVVGGNFLIGLIVFLVLVLINFIVVTKGATRIAEVAARFTLDAMPGKQMSIDADLNAGLITDSDARKRRSDIEREADFYGAMDGASKFVRGDAIAGIIITLINIVGGLIIGVLQKGMPIIDASHTYTLLTVGDGLVTQIPALIVSTAAGMLVTRSASTTDLGSAIKGQMFFDPRVIATASGMLFIFAIIPGMPTLSFLTIAAVMGVLAFAMRRAAGKMQAREDLEKPPEATKPPDPTDLLVPVDALELDVGYNLIPLVDTNQGGELLQRIKVLRKQIALDMGFIIPAIHIRDDLQLKPNQYVVKLKGVEIAQGELMVDHYLVITPDDKKLKVKGIPTKEPAFGLPALWVSERDREEVQARGLVVVDTATVATTHLTEIIKDHAYELMGRQDVQALLDNLSTHHPRMMEELVPSVVSLGILCKVLQRLLREKIPIRDLVTILESLADYAPMTKNVDLLTGYVRQSLARTITKQYQDSDGNITVAIVAPEIEETVGKTIQHTEYESFAHVDSGTIQRIIKGLHKSMAKFTEKGAPPILLCSPTIRWHIRKIVERYFPQIAVLAHNEVLSDIHIKSLGMVGTDDAG